MVFSGFSLVLDQSSGKLTILGKFYHPNLPIKKVNPHLKSKIQALNLKILFTKLLPTFYLLSSLFSFFLPWLKRKKTASKSHWQFFSPKIFDAADYFSFKTFLAAEKNGEDSFPSRVKSFECEMVFCFGLAPFLWLFLSTLVLFSAFVARIWILDLA